MACIFSAFSTATLAAIFASGIWVIGHAMTDFRLLIDKMDPPAVVAAFDAAFADIARELIAWTVQTL